ncbi:hypothetical protein [Sinorhizobium sp. RAC02]|uniref:hypothetical protein n=1 Tax=Sinorhizobium sp. RAC02 TaxID=1842534 RepID=UPI0012377834|nr:hypothetical protein [Sinorhizobium sp. RAC02]
MQDNSFDDSMPPDLISHYKPLAIPALVAACSIKPERSVRAEPSLQVRQASQFHDVPDDRDEPATAFVR